MPALSTIQLDAYVVYKPKGDGFEVLHGTDLGFDAASGKYVIEYPSAILPDGAKIKHDVFIALYGFRDSVAEMAAINKHFTALDPKAVVQVVNLNFDVGRIEPNVIHLKDLPGLRFVNVKRCAKEIQDHIFETFKGYLEDKPAELAKLEKLRHIARFPDLFARLLVEDDLFVDVEVLIAPIALPGDMASHRQFAFVKRSAVLMEVIQNPAAAVFASTPRMLMGPNAD